MPPKTKPKTSESFPSVKGPDGSLPTFMCGNHTPAHTAKTIKKVIELNKKKGCKAFVVIIQHPVL